jgi:hypothetical protein
MLPDQGMSWVGDLLAVAMVTAGAAVLWTLEGRTAVRAWRRARRGSGAR